HPRLSSFPTRRSSDLAVLITDGPNVEGMNLAGLPNLRRVFTTRRQAQGSEPFANLLRSVSTNLLAPDRSSRELLAALPYSSGTRSEEHTSELQSLRHL